MESKRIKLSKKYHSIQEKYSFLPSSPIGIFKNSKSSFYLKRTFQKIKNLGISDSLIREEINYYQLNHHKLEDLQISSHMIPFLELLKQIKNVEGDILELGTYKGGSTIIMAHLLKKLKSNKTIFACDSFSGIPYEDKFSKKMYENCVGEFGDTNYNYVLEKIKNFGFSKQISVINGLFEDTLYQKLSDKKFSFVLFDCDIYDSTKFGLEFVFPRLANNGIMFFQDYSLDEDNVVWGMKQAVDDFFINKNLVIQKTPIPHFKKLQ